VDLRRQIAIARLWLPFVVVCVLLGAGAAYLVSSRLSKVYEAQATLVVGQSLSAVSPDYNQLLVSQQLSTTYARVATTRPILENVIKQLSLSDTTDSLGSRVRADASTDSTLMTITARDTDPSVAAAIANAVADQLIAVSPAIQGRQTDFQQSIDADLQATQAQISASQAKADELTAMSSRTVAQEAELQTLQSQLVTLRSTLATLLSFSTDNAATLVSVVEPAVPPTSPVSPNVPLYVLMAAFLGGLIATTIAFTAEYLDDRVKNPEGVHEVTGLPTLGTIALIKRERRQRQASPLVTLLTPRSDAAEAYRTLRTNIEFASVDASLRTLLVTSSSQGEGKTATATNLAVVFAMTGRRVLLVDADLRLPGIHIVFDLPNKHGLTTLLRSEEVETRDLVHDTEQENLQVMTTGPLPPNPADLLGSLRMHAVLERLKSEHDLIIFDSPGLQSVTDSAVLGSFLDGTILVIDSETSHRRIVRQAREALDRVGANVLGAVLNRLPAKRSAELADEYEGYSTKRAPSTEETPEQVSV
jgi:capsular exopolysaccharide synthesis family protein